MRVTGSVREGHPPQPVPLSLRNGCICVQPRHFGSCLGGKSSAYPSLLIQPPRLPPPPVLNFDDCAMQSAQPDNAGSSGRVGLSRPRRGSGRGGWVGGWRGSVGRNQKSRLRGRELFWEPPKRL